MPQAVERVQSTSTCTDEHAHNMLTSHTVHHSREVTDADEVHTARLADTRLHRAATAAAALSAGPRSMVAEVQPADRRLF